MLGFTKVPGGNPLVRPGQHIPLGEHMTSFGFSINLNEKENMCTEEFH